MNFVLNRKPQPNGALASLYENMVLPFRFLCSNGLSKSKSGIGIEGDDLGGYEYEGEGLGNGLGVG